MQKFIFFVQKYPQSECEAEMNQKEKNCTTTVKTAIGQQE